MNRRAFLRDASVTIAGASLSVAATTLPAASDGGYDAEVLAMLCAQYQSAHVASRDAERAWRDAYDQYHRLRRAADIWVPYTGNGYVEAKVGGNYREVEIGVAEHQLRKDRAAALAAANGGNARRSARARYARLQKKIQTADDRCKHVRITSGLEAAIDHDCVARRRAYAAKDALMAYRPRERFSEYPAWAPVGDAEP